MSYPRQDSVSARLQDEINSTMDQVRDGHKKALKRAWMVTRRELQAEIYDAYRRAAPQGRWSLPMLRISGAQNHMQVMIHASLVRFHAMTTAQMRKGFKDMRWKSALRHGWLLDQVTPESRKVRLPLHAAIREAGILKQVTQTSWDERWSQWVDSYAVSLSNNLRMEAINESSIQDALDEVDATRVNTPAATLENAMNRIFDYEAMAAIAAGEDDIVRLNPDLVEEEVWKTRGDAKVCDDCDGNEGMTAEEADGEIPLHPNCNCYWLVVPASYADLLQSGSPADQSLARQMLSRGLVPNSLTIQGEDGDLTGKAIVDFEQWVEGQPMVVGGR